MTSQWNYDFRALRGLFALSAIVLSALAFTLLAAPATVLADSAAGQYTEPILPEKPPVSNGGDKQPGGASGSPNGDNSNGSDNDSGGSSGDQGSAGSGSSGGASGSGTPSGDDSGGAAGGSGQDDDGSDQNGGAGGSGSSGGDGNSTGANPSGESARNALGDDSGGSTLWLIAALLVGVPLLVGGGWYLLSRRDSQEGDDETRDRLRAAVGGTRERSRQRPTRPEAR
jgi:hypothetical protein